MGIMITHVAKHTCPQASFEYDMYTFVTRIIVGNVKQRGKETKLISHPRSLDAAHVTHLI